MLNYIIGATIFKLKHVKKVSSGSKRFMVIFFVYETFLFENIGKAVLKALLSYVVSLPVIFILIFIFNPKR